MSKHIPVMLHEAINALDIISNGFYIDCTFGRGGHSESILKSLGNDGKLIAIDKDKDAEDYAKNNFREDKRFIFEITP